MYGRKNDYGKENSEMKNKNTMQRNTERASNAKKRERKTIAPELPLSGRNFFAGIIKLTSCIVVFRCVPRLHSSRPIAKLAPARAHASPEGRNNRERQI